MRVTAIFAQYICDLKHFYVNRCMAIYVPSEYSVLGRPKFSFHVLTVKMTVSFCISSINSKELDLLFFKILGLHKVSH